VYSEWIEHPGVKPLIIPAGTTNGFAMRNSDGTRRRQHQHRNRVHRTSFL
jgi:hypothetical protein